MLSSLFPLRHSHYSSLPVLGGVLEGLCGWLLSRGYPPDAIRRRVASARLLDQRLRDRRIHSLRQCTASDLRACFPQPERWTARFAGSLGRSLIEYLSDTGELAAARPTPAQELVAGYCGHLESVRGLSPQTIGRHSTIALRFLHSLQYDERPNRLGDLKAGDIDAFLTDTGQRVGRITMGHVTARLRAFLRFAALRGQAPAGLDQHVELPRRYRGERLPRSMSRDSVEFLLRSIDRSTPKGLRDYAMLLLIATYGLRVGEVAELSLEDIAWRDRRIHIPRPKIGTPLVLPLTDEIAHAILDYLRHGRPTSEHRRLFLQVRVPRDPIKTYAISDAFQAWAIRAGIPLPRPGGPHCLRHSLAMHLLRRGTPLKTIGDLLGHRSVESTCVYLRLDVDDLRDAALPLPGASAASEVQP